MDVISLGVVLLHTTSYHDKKDSHTWKIFLQEWLVFDMASTFGQHIFEEVPTHIYVASVARCFLFKTTLWTIHDEELVGVAWSERSSSTSVSAILSSSSSRSVYSDSRSPSWSFSWSKTLWRSRINLWNLRTVFACAARDSCQCKLCRTWASNDFGWVVSPNHSFKPCSLYRNHPSWISPNHAIVRLLFGTSSRPRCPTSVISRLMISWPNKSR